MFCENCGARVSDHARYCYECGAVITRRAGSSEPLPKTEEYPQVARDPEPSVSPMPPASETETSLLLDSYDKTVLLDDRSETRQMLDRSRPGYEAQHYETTPLEFAPSLEGEPLPDAGLDTIPEESVPQPVEAVSETVNLTGEGLSSVPVSPEEPAVVELPQSEEERPHSGARSILLGIVVGVLIVVAVAAVLLFATKGGSKPSPEQPAEPTIVEPEVAMSEEEARSLYEAWASAEFSVQVPVGIEGWQAGSTQGIVEISGRVFGSGETVYRKEYVENGSFATSLKPGSYTFTATGLGVLSSGQIFRGSDRSVIVHVGEAEDAYDNASAWIAKLQEGEKLPITKVDAAGELSYFALAVGMASESDLASAIDQAKESGRYDEPTLGELAKRAKDFYGWSEQKPDAPSSPSTATIDDWKMKACDLLSYLPANHIPGKSKRSDPVELELEEWALACMRYVDPSSDLGMDLDRVPDEVALEHGFYGDPTVVTDTKFAASDDHGVYIYVEGLTTKKKWSNADEWHYGYYVRFSEENLIESVTLTTDNADFSSLSKIK